MAKRKSPKKKTAKKTTKKKTAKPKPNKKGRPAGSGDIDRAWVAVDPSRCDKCDSTERSRYIGSPVECNHPGFHDDKPYTHIVRRRTICESCGQHRFDLFYENRPAPRGAER